MNDYLSQKLTGNLTRNNKQLIIDSDISGSTNLNNFTSTPEQVRTLNLRRLAHNSNQQIRVALKNKREEGFHRGLHNAPPGLNIQESHGSKNLSSQES